MLPLLAARTHEEGFPPKTRIPRFWDSTVPVSGRTGEDTVHSSTSRYRLEEPLYLSSPLGIRVRIGMICRGCELEISGTLLTVDLRIMDMSEFDVILGMDWLTSYRVVIDCERRRVTAYTQDSTRVVFQGDKHDILPQTVYESRCQEQLAGWLASLTLENEVRPDLDLPRVACEYEDVFPNELPGLPPQRVVDFGIELHPSTSPISMTPHRMAPVEL